MPKLLLLVLSLELKDKVVEELFKIFLFFIKSVRFIVLQMFVLMPYRILSFKVKINV